MSGNGLEPALRVSFPHQPPSQRRGGKNPFLSAKTQEWPAFDLQSTFRAREKERGGGDSRAQAALGGQTSNPSPSLTEEVLAPSAFSAAAPSGAAAPPSTCLAPSLDPCTASTSCSIPLFSGNSSLELTVSSFSSSIPPKQLWKSLVTA